MSESTETTAYFRLEQDDENNLALDIKGKGGELAAMLASAMDDDPEIKKLFEFALLMVEMKDKEGEDESGEEGESTFFDAPHAEA